MTESPYVNMISTVENDDVEFARWKLTRDDGNWKFLELHAEDPNKAFELLHQTFASQYEIVDGYNGTATSDQIFIRKNHNWIIVHYLDLLEEELHEIVKEIPAASPDASILWWFMTRNGPDCREVPLKGLNPVDEFYPWLHPKTIDEFADEFANSSANVLLLFGPPGTGKTSFIRRLIRKMKYETWVTYDPDMHLCEEFYVRFVTDTDEKPAQSGARYGFLDSPSFEYEVSPQSPPKNQRETTSIGRCLVMEDADEMLLKRENGNKLMNRILNLSDGLVSLPARKIIFSTNLPGLREIDEALYRPGRCFGAIKFRELTKTEGEVACRAVGIEPKINQEKLTLAQALNPQEHKYEVKMIGFT